MASNKKEPVKNTLAISINLLPPEYRKKQKDFTWVTDRRIIWPTVAAIVAIVAVLMLQAFINETISGLSDELSRVQEEVERERPLLSKISDLEQETLGYFVRKHFLGAAAEHVDYQYQPAGRIRHGNARRHAGLPRGCRIYG